MIKVIEGNLFDSKAKFIVHQVNCQGKMNSGVALEVKTRYPHVFEEYKKVCHSDMLGKVQIVPTNIQYLRCDSGSKAVPHTEQFICNFFSQDKYGYDGKTYTSLDALQKCLNSLKCKIHEKNNNFGTTIAMPYKIGCVRGGADWNIVYQMIEDTFVDCNVELWRLDNG